MIRNCSDEVEAAQRAVSLGHAIRKEYKLKVRQPLLKAHLITSNPELMNALKKQSQVIADELNVKSIEFHDEEGAFVQWIGQAQFSRIGKEDWQIDAARSEDDAKFRPTQMKHLADGRSVTIHVNGETIELSRKTCKSSAKSKKSWLPAMRAN